MSNTGPTQSVTKNVDGTQVVTPGFAPLVTGGAPTGPAGGDLRGDYPNPSVIQCSVAGGFYPTTGINYPNGDPFMGDDGTIYFNDGNGTAVDITGQLYWSGFNYANTPLADNSGNLRVANGNVLADVSGNLFAGGQLLFDQSAFAFYDNLGNAAINLPNRLLIANDGSTPVLNFYSQAGAIANATNSVDVITQLNALLAAVRNYGLIAT